jgi:hypothetical protein
VAGQVASDWIGFQEGVDISVYHARKGLVQLANGSRSVPILLEANEGSHLLVLGAMEEAAW